MNIPSVPKPQNPVLADKVISEIQDILKTQLPWLNYSFGRAQRLVTSRDSKTDFFYPGVHIGDKTYISMLPDNKLGNFSFFVLDDPHTIDFEPRSYNKIKSRFALIFWFNLSKIFLGSSDRNLENVKAQILELLTRRMGLRSGRLTLDKVFEQAENIYRSYSLKELEAQFLMHPYGGLRFEGELSYEETC